MQNKGLFVGSSILLATALGCVDGELHGTAYFEENGNGGGCEEFGCGGNSGVVNGFPISELSLDGYWSQQGFRITGYRSASGGAMTLNVHDGKFFVVWPTGAETTFSDRHAGAKILVQRDPGVAGAPLENYEIRIDSVGTIKSLANGAPTVYSYMLSYSDPATGKHVPLCWAPDAADPELWVRTYAVLVVNERYDTETSVVRPTKEIGWFNIACAGSALAKMKLLGYDPETPSSSSFFTRPSQRQATLKMLTADYCGTGHSYTTTGQPLLWQNTQGWFSDPFANPSATSFEAVWTENGAICLDVPRRPDLWNDPRAPFKCVLPSCQGASTTSGEWWTVNRK